MHRDPVEQIQARPPLYGVLAAIPDVRDTGEIRWSEGFSFSPDACANSGTVALNCHGNTSTLTAATRPATVDGDPFVVWAADKCSSLGSLGVNTRDEFLARANRALLAGQSYEIAQELWKGTIAQAETLENNWLTSIGSDVLSPTGVAMTPIGALACLDHGLGRCGKGRRGLIHVTPQLLAHLASAYVIDLTAPLPGGLWLTPMGNIVVADAGYDGSPPDNLAGGFAGASQWAYATSMMQIMLGPPEAFAGGFSLATDQMKNLDRSLNTVVVYAERLAAIKWDGCCHLAAEVNLPICAFGGVS